MLNPEGFLCHPRRLRVFFHDITYNGPIQRGYGHIYGSSLLTNYINRSIRNHSMSLRENLKEFIKDRNVACVMPTSQHAVRGACKRIDFSRDIVVVEYGPGTGPYTKYILKNMTEGSKLIVIETNERFVEMLEQINDPRLIVFHDSAENIRHILTHCSIAKADYVLSGIPFSNLDDASRDAIIMCTQKVLADGGLFLVVYQFVPLIRWDLKKHFQKVSTDMQLFNLPPFFVFEAASC